MKLDTLAEELRATFTRKTRDNGTEFYKTDDDRARDIAYDAHGDMMPDDHRYEMVVRALDLIAEHGEDADVYEIEAPAYNPQLTDWLGSHGWRPGYCDDAAQEVGGDVGGVMALIGLGWHAEMREVFDSVLTSLQEIVDNSDDE